MDVPHVPKDVDGFSQEEIKVSGWGGWVRIGHCYIKHGLEVIATKMLGKKGKTLGSRSDVVLQNRKAFASGILEAFLLLLFGEPGAFTIDGHLRR